MASSNKEDSYFCSIEIDKQDKNYLGTWCYGSIYKATCDQLPCTAKLLNPVLFQDSPSDLCQEMAFLMNLRHPNIVQYLGLHQDPDTKLPILLTEAMDESLTSFLERSSAPLPYHIQLDLSHDIALAINYLHSRKIIHRNISSDSILLLLNSRAKLSNLIIPKLEEVVSSTRQFTLNREACYLPPEALREPAVYSDKTDCFSFAPLLIQMITRKYPKPGPQTQEVEDPQSPAGISYKVVLETERRKDHLSLIDPQHPLLPIINKCLPYRAQERPSALQLCQDITTLKDEEKYCNSKKQDQKPLLQSSNEGGAKTLNKEVNFTWSPSEQVEYSGFVQSAIKGDTVYYVKDGEYFLYKYTDKEKQFSRISTPVQDYSVAIIQGLVTLIGGETTRTTGLMDSFDDIRPSYNKLYSLINEATSEWKEYYPPMSHSACRAPTAVYEDKLVIVANSQEGVMEIFNMTQWRTINGCYNINRRSSLTLCGDTMYLAGGYNYYGYDHTNMFYSCSIAEILGNDSISLKKHADAPKFASGYAAIDGKLLAFGGQHGNDDYPHSKKPTSDIYEYDPKKDCWKVIGQLPHARSQCCASALSNNKLIIVGGYMLSETIKHTEVTVMDTATYTYM